MALFLPTELWFWVFKHLDVESLYSLYSTCSDFRRFIVENDETIFKPVAHALSPMGLADPIEDDTFWVDSHSKWLNSCIKLSRKSNLFQVDYGKNHIPRHNAYDTTLEEGPKCKIMAAIPIQLYVKAHEPLYTQKLYFGYSGAGRSVVVEKILNSRSSRRVAGSLFYEVTKYSDTLPVFEIGSRNDGDRTILSSVPLPSVHSRRTNQIVGLDPYIIMGSSARAVSCTITAVRNDKCIFHIDYPTGRERRALINNRVCCVVEEHRMRIYELHSNQLLVDRNWTGLNYRMCSLTDTHFLTYKRFSGIGWYVYPLEALINPQERFLERAPVERRLANFPPPGYSLDAGVMHCIDRFVILKCMSSREVIVYDALTKKIGRYNYSSKYGSNVYRHSIEGFWFFGEDGGVYSAGRVYLDQVVNSR
ncbi:hypothetical protein TRVA0_014S01134 [Trichomonascus vanleenenianus]|uniref:uncharacterized protein n=1 Tax=Trichomonascus vanleenenianus TaxID=2268995 RepID=UPI003ECB48A5